MKLYYSHFDENLHEYRVSFDTRAKTEAGIVRAAKKAMMDRHGIECEPNFREIEFKSLYGMGRLYALVETRDDSPAEWNRMFDLFQRKVRR